MIDNFTAILLIISFVGLAIIALYNFKAKSRRLFNNLYAYFAIVLMIWVGAVIGMKFTQPEDHPWLYIWDSLSNIGTAFVPIMMLYISLAYTKNLSRLPHKYYLLMIVPILTVIMIWTNPLHHLHYSNFSIDNFSIVASEIQFGPYMLISAAYSYTCLVLALYFLIRFSRKNTRFYTMQIVLFCIGNFVPNVVSVLATTKIVDVSIAFTPLAFVVTLICHGLAIFRYKMLNITPIAVQTILDKISDCYLVFNDVGTVVDFNKPMKENFGSIIRIERGLSLSEVFEYSPDGNEDKFTWEWKKEIEQTIIETKEELATNNYDTSIVINSETRYFSCEIAPIIEKERFIGILIMLKDITRSKLDMEKIRQNQARLLERERLASLGQLIAGIAHNLKTPIMSMTGGILALERLAQEYKSSIPDKTVTKEDHLEIADEMLSWLSKMRPYCSYMSDIITAVKDQAVQMNASSIREFSVDELVKRVELLMRHELNRRHCVMNVYNQMKKRTILSGDINNLVQALNNLISNSIDAYGEKGGEINMYIYFEEHRLVFCLEDFGCGMTEDIRSKLFKEMITTKGSQGTGIGVYMSSVVIRGKFGGEMECETEFGHGSKFYIKIPRENVAEFEY